MILKLKQKHSHKNVSFSCFTSCFFYEFSSCLGFCFCQFLFFTVATQKGEEQMIIKRKECTHLRFAMGLYCKQMSQGAHTESLFVLSVCYVRKHKELHAILWLQSQHPSETMPMHPVIIKEKLKNKVIPKLSEWLKVFFKGNVNCYCDMIE